MQSASSNNPQQPPPTTTSPPPPPPSLNRRSNRKRPSSAHVNSNELAELLDRFILEDQNQAHGDSDLDASDIESDESSDDGDVDSDSDANSEHRRKKRAALKSKNRQVDQFLVLLAISLQEYGCPTAAMESHMNAVAEGLGRPAKFSFFNGYAFASWELGESGRSKTHLFGTWSALDVYKLQLCDELARHVASYSLESNVTSSKSSLHQPNSSAMSNKWLKKLYLSLGGTLYGVNIDNTKTDTDDIHSVSNAARLKARILHLASVGPNVFKQFKKNEYGSTMIESPAVTQPEEPHTLEIVEATSTETLPNTPEFIQMRSEALNLKHKRNSSFASFSKLSQQLSRSLSVKSEPPPNPKAKVKHIQIFTSIAVSDALKRLKQIRSAPSPYPSWLSIIICGLSCAGCCAIFFGGGWNDVLASFILGSLVGGVSKLCSYNESFQRISEFLSALVVAFCCRLMVVFNFPICPGATTISSIIQIVQGTNITLSIMELASKHPGAGVSRLAYSLTVTALIGIGLQFGDALSLAITKSPKTVELTVLATCPQSLSITAQWAVFAPTILVFLIDLNAHPRQFFFMAVTSTVAQVVWTYANPALNDPLSSFLAAFSMGAISNLYSHVTLSNPVVGVLAGLQVLVPGTLAVRALASQDVTSGVSLAGSVLVIALSLGLGLFLGSVVAGGASGFVKKGRSTERNHVLSL
ncbi:DUF1212-domain-containing protein [Rhizoclosmatium globosum]|uniref:DUF1212-domain-containing protein n=1 Tax=Rhizoclosmatium globosum TaxID=329046 RepID=A0A1Y2C602_9FUNG|nr:DUF1212-domain-containing protein [Rhizoclosmatium globosum]|eukprot:ORY42366.1 DUF1212-domain-containing protein [Rhizoclosmatium globosum]